ncbi:hypothetical protein GCM10022204_26750 [Microlunatus aurantiacus]|uniref:Site-specific recombinase XerD n=2 Tax=Microlunatus aurantiacus TaxID=446786 RepID=A0ABP7DQ12_9ACTN
MSPRKQRARKVPADPDRWPPCVRCGQAYRDASAWPEGRVCCYCKRAAQQREGTCARCGHHGVVPGLIDDQPACVQCSSVPVDVRCRRCGQEAPMGFAVTCWRCQLQAQLTALLADPDGVIRPALQPFVDALLGLPQPRIAYVWIRRNTAVQTTLRRLGTGEAPLDHATFDQLPGRTTEYLRGLLVEHGCLPGRDRYLAAFENWLPTKLDRIPDPGARRHIDAFARWHLLRQLRDRAKREPIPAGAFLNAKQSTTVAINFLNWLTGRGRQLETVTQADVDAWYANGPSTRHHASRFLGWAQEQHLIRIDQPRLTHNAGPIMTESERLDQLNRLLHDRTLPATPRLIGLLVLMFGQPLSRVVRLPRDAVAVADGQTSLRLGRHALDLPPEVEAVVHDHLAHITDHRNEAGHLEPRWLFPGLQPGQPLHVFSAAGMLKEIGVSARAARNTAWQQMVQQAPAAILADGLGAQRGTAARHAKLAGADYASYPGAAGRNIAKTVESP